MKGINLRAVGSTKVGITLDERTRPATVEAVWRAFGIRSAGQGLHAALPHAGEPDPQKSDFLTHPVFHMNRAETEMMRYMRRLADRDLALDRAMIPLGSCTMKLNSAAEMMPVSWREFSLLHPYVPADQAAGYTRYDRRSVGQSCVTSPGMMRFRCNRIRARRANTPGLLTIAGYHRAQWSGASQCCLIPMSAHGTNPASLRWSVGRSLR